MPSDDRPLWRAAVDRFDRVVTPPANAFVRSSAFADMTAAGIRLESRVRRRLERALGSWWHLWNLPTASDQRSIRARLVAVEARLRDIADHLEDPAVGAALADVADEVAALERSEA